jgi:hypothetical protein
MSHEPQPPDGLERLPREIPPERDLWPQIQARLATGRKPKRWWLVSAASLGLGLIGWGLAGWWWFGRGDGEQAGWFAERNDQRQAFRVGDTLSTAADENLTVALSLFGRIDLHPNSTLRRVASHEREHRFALERGSLEAFVYAPPRLFVVDTPATTAVDLGCRYTLQVDHAGDTVLHVLSGRVSLIGQHGEIVIPSGAKCRATERLGPGIPYYADAPRPFVEAIAALENGDTSPLAAQRLAAAMRSLDAGSLAHALAWVEGEARRVLVERLAAQPETPADLNVERLMTAEREAIDRLARSLMPARWID